MQRVYTHSYPLVAKTFRETFGEKKGKHSHKVTIIFSKCLVQNKTLSIKGYFFVYLNESKVETFISSVGT